MYATFLFYSGHLVRKYTYNFLYKMFPLSNKHMLNHIKNQQI